MHRHRRQHVLGPAAVVDQLALPGWRSTSVADDVVLAHDAELPVTELRDADGARWLLLGTAVDAVGTGVGPTLAAAGTDAVPDASRRFGGRFALLGPRWLVPDATSLLGALHQQVAGRLVVTSSPALAAQLAGHPGLRPLPRGSGHGGLYLNYVVPPASRVRGVDRLMGTQLLDWRTGEIQPRSCLPPVPAGSEDELLDRFGELLVQLVAGLAELGPVHLPLTGGHDSRLWLAAASRAGVDVQTFTFTYPQMKAADRQLPARIAEVAGVPHREVRPGRADPARRRLFDEHTAGSVVEFDRDFIARGQYDVVPRGAMLLRAGAFEIGSRAHLHQFAALPATSEPPPVGVIGPPLGADPADPALADPLERWRRWVVEADDGTDWRIRLYLEGRVGGYLAAVEQALDLLDPRSVVLANCGLLWATTTQLPLSTRLAQQHHKDLVTRWLPAAAQIPYNPPDTLLGKVRRHVRALVDRNLGRRGR